MQNCWHEVPTKRPTFTELKSKLEHLMSQDTPYIELAIDRNQEYYLKPSFKSVNDSEENDEKDNDVVDDDGGRGIDDDDDDDDGNHSPKVFGNLSNATELRYKTMFEC